MEGSLGSFSLEVWKTRLNDRLIGLTDRKTMFPRTKTQHEEAAVYLVGKLSVNPGKLWGRARIRAACPPNFESIALDIYYVESVTLLVKVPLLRNYPSKVAITCVKSTTHNKRDKITIRKFWETHHQLRKIHKAQQSQ
jgi:hypothetical protein